MPRLMPVVTALLAVTLGGCRTMIPATDTTPPRVELTITGPGIGRQVMTNPPRSEWTGSGGAQLFELQPRARFNFTLAVSDSGGVARAHLRMPATFTVSDLSPAGVTNTADALSRSLTLLGNRDDPRTGLVIGGTLETPAAGGLSFEFQAEGDDFGGTSGGRNQAFLSVNAAVGLPVP